MTGPSSTPRYRVNLSAWCASVLRRCYPGQVPATVVERALHMLAAADGHLTPGGQIKTGRRP